MKKNNLNSKLNGMIETLSRLGAKLVKSLNLHHVAMIDMPMNMNWQEYPAGRRQSINEM